MVTSWGLAFGRFVPPVETHAMRVKHVQFNNIFHYGPESIVRVVETEYSPRFP
jgi:hypothetical protein